MTAPAPPTSLQTVKVIGNGAFGSVYLVKDANTNALFAMKVIKCAIMNEQQQQYLMREIGIMRKAIHPALLRLTGFSLPSDKSPDATILTEFMTNGSLFAMLQSERRRQAPREWNATAKTKIIIGVAAGMRYLHSLDIIHRDLKSENVLLDEKLEPKIGDFGLSKVVQGNDAKANTQRLGTPLYMAPELFRNAPYDHKVDVYAFGMLTFEVVTGINPFADLSNPMALGMKVVQGVRPEIPSTCPEPYRRLIEVCWSQEATARPEFSRVVEMLLDDEFMLPGSQRESVREYRRRVCPELGEQTRTGDGKSVKQLEDAIAQKSRELDDLKKTVAEQHAMVMRLLEAEKSERAQLKAKIEVMESKLDQVQRENSELKNENKELRTLLEKAGRPDQLQAELLSHTRRLDGYAEDLKNAGMHLDSLHKETDTMKRNLNGFRIQMSNDISEIRRALNIPEPIFQPEIYEKKMRQNSDPRELREMPLRVKGRSKRNSETRRSDTSLLAKLTTNEELRFRSRPFNGICAHLTETNGGRNIALSGAIKITGESYNTLETEKLPHIVDYEWDSAWGSSFSDSAWIMFDFLTRQVSVCAYTIKTYDSPPQSLHLRSWVLEGSNDSRSWSELDEQSDSNRLNGPNKVFTFTCKHPSKPPSRYIRLRQTGPSHGGPGSGFSLTNIEFFGYIV